MSPQARMAAGSEPVPDAGVGTSGDAGAGPFVINLTSSTTPMALSHPDSPELKRFSFFVSRRREDNRERFRLHMGYFSTLAEAEEWLNVIRDLYPGAWAGEAPGKKLRSPAAAAELARKLPAPPPARQGATPSLQSTSGRPASPAGSGATSPSAAAHAGAAALPGASTAMPPTAVAAAAPVGAMPEAPVPINIPTLQAAPVGPAGPQVTVTASAAPMLEAVAQAAAALAAVAKMAQQSSPGAFAAPEQTVMAPNPFAGAAEATVLAPSPLARAADPTVLAPAVPGASDPTVLAPSPLPASPAHRAAAPAPAAPALTAPSAQSQTNTHPAAAGSSAVTKAPAQPAKPAAAAPARPAAKSGKKNVANVLTDGSNVREVLAALDDIGDTRQMPAPASVPRVSPATAKPAAPAAASARSTAAAPGRASTASAQNVAPSAPSNLAQLGVAHAARSPRSPAVVAGQTPGSATAPPARVPGAESSGDTMSDTQVLRMLETRRADGGDKGSDDANAGISLLKPDDTQTRRALKEAVIENAPVSFAVQLQWSVQPVELDKVPPLAIFSAYTLYTVEGSREGRKWYGLRLGFFSDAISAKQVAYYVRSEFASVAVVPVSPAEKARASDKEAKATAGSFPRKRVEQKVEEFKLFDDDEVPAASAPAPARPAAAKPAAAAKEPPVRKKPLGRVKARERRSPKTLEETLEILGASDLEIDNGRGELLNDTGVRHLRVEVQKNTPFAKLLDRITERVRKN